LEQYAAVSYVGATYHIYAAVSYVGAIWWTICSSELRWWTHAERDGGRLVECRTSSNRCALSSMILKTALLQGRSRMHFFPYRNDLPPEVSASFQSNHKLKKFFRIEVLSLLKEVPASYKFIHLCYRLRRHNRMNSEPLNYNIVHCSFSIHVGSGYNCLCNISFSHLLLTLEL